jgi:hypothetical protein
VYPNLTCFNLPDSVVYRVYIVLQGTPNTRYVLYSTVLYSFYSYYYLGCISLYSNHTSLYCTHACLMCTQLYKYSKYICTDMDDSTHFGDSVYQYSTRHDPEGHEKSYLDYSRDPRESYPLMLHIPSYSVIYEYHTKYLEYTVDYYLLPRHVAVQRSSCCSAKILLENVYIS